MARPYGRYPKHARKVRADAQPRNFRIKLHGRCDLEQMSFLMQKLIARLQEQGVHSVENCAVYLAPLDRAGDRMAPKNRDGKTVETIEIAISISERFIKATSP